MHNISVLPIHSSSPGEHVLRERGTLPSCPTLGPSTPVLHTMEGREEKRLGRLFHLQNDKNILELHYSDSYHSLVNHYKAQARGVVGVTLCSQVAVGGGEPSVPVRLSVMQGDRVQGRVHATRSPKDPGVL